MVKPWLHLPAPISYRLGHSFLRWYGRFKPFKTLTWSPFTWKDLEFTNPLGIAGGVDKDADSVTDWWCFGPGFIEVGTVTPKAQKILSGKNLDRNNKSNAVWNRMGFPSKGVDHLAAKLKSLQQPHFTPIFVNIGKNRDTKNSEAHLDYIYCLEKLTGLADAFVINISSPNTKDLRELLKPDNLKSFLQPIVDKNRQLQSPKTLERPTPLLLKISPDLSNEELQQVLQVSLDLDMDGWVLTNTTTERPDGIDFPETGGLSGRPLTKRSQELLRKTVEFLGPEKEGKLIVSVGGVMSPEEVFDRLRLGANLVQVYSALIFDGPFFFKEASEIANP